MHRDHLLAEIGELAGHRRRRPDPQPRVAPQGRAAAASTSTWSGCSWVISTASAPSRAASTSLNDAGVDDQRAVTVVEADAGVGVLGELHRSAYSSIDVHRGFLGAGDLAGAADVGRDLVRLVVGVRALVRGDAAARPGARVVGGVEVGLGDVRLLLGQLLVQRLALARLGRRCSPRSCAARGRAGCSRRRSGSSVSSPVRVSDGVELVGVADRVADSYTCRRDSLMRPSLPASSSCPSRAGSST